MNTSRRDAGTGITEPQRKTLPEATRGTLAACFLMLYAVSAVLFYIWIVSPYLDQADLLAPRLLADSITYVTQCPDREMADWFWWRDAGPCLALQLFNNSLALVSMANAALLLLAAQAFAACYRIRFGLIVSLLLINPMTCLSLFGPNKEIFGLVTVICLLIYFRTRSLRSLLLTLCFAFFSRVSMFATIAPFIAIAMVLLPPANTSRVSRRFAWVAACILVGATVLANILNTEAQILILGDVSDAEDNSQSTIFSLSLEPLNAYGLYVVTYAIRLALNLYGALANLGSASLSTHGVYYVFGVMGSSLLFLVMTAVAFSRKHGRLLYLNTEGLQICAFCLFFTLVLCTSPVIQHRYFFPLYPVLVLSMATQVGQRRSVGLLGLPATAVLDGSLRHDPLGCTGPRSPRAWRSITVRMPRCVDSAAAQELRDLPQILRDQRTQAADPMPAHRAQVFSTFQQHVRKRAIADTACTHPD